MTIAISPNNDDFWYRISTLSFFGQPNFWKMPQLLIGQLLLRKTTRVPDIWSYLRRGKYTKTDYKIKIARHFCCLNITNHNLHKICTCLFTCCIRSRTVIINWKRDYSIVFFLGMGKSFVDRPQINTKQNGLHHFLRQSLFLR